MVPQRILYFTLAIFLQFSAVILSLYYLWLLILSPLDLYSLSTLFKIFQVFGLIVISEVLWCYENEFRRENLNVEDKALLQKAIDGGLSVLSCNERAALEEVMPKLKSRFQIY